MSSQGYAQHTSELQIRLVADFSCWLAKRRIQARKVTPELFRPYLRMRAQRRRPTGNDLSALHRLLDLLIRQGVISAPLSPAATPAELLQSEFGLYLQQERALASTTQNCYLTFVSEFLTDRFGAGPVDLSCLCAADVTGFVRRRAAGIQSRRVQLMTTPRRRVKAITTKCACPSASLTQEIARGRRCGLSCRALQTGLSNNLRRHRRSGSH